VQKIQCLDGLSPRRISCTGASALSTATLMRLHHTSVRYCSLVDHPCRVPISHAWSYFPYEFEIRAVMPEFLGRRQAVNGITTLISHNYSCKAYSIASSFRCSQPLCWSLPNPFVSLLEVSRAFIGQRTFARLASVSTSIPHVLMDPTLYPENQDGCSSTPSKASE